MNALHVANADTYASLKIDGYKVGLSSLNAADTCPSLNTDLFAVGAEKQLAQKHLHDQEEGSAELLSPESSPAKAILTNVGHDRDAKCVNPVAEQNK